MGRTRLTKADRAFARGLAPHVLWARQCNHDEPAEHLTREEQLAVALVLRNDEYISKLRFSPWAMAYAYVCKGRLGEYGDEVQWINLVRDAIDRFNREPE